MDNLTLAQLKTRVTEPLGLEEEVGEGQFIETAELNTYINDGIEIVQRIILKLYEDYFLTPVNLAMVTGEQDITLPAGVYAHKIRSIIYDEGTNATHYEIKRLPQKDKFRLIPEVDSGDDYHYMLVNVSNVVKIRLYPASRITNSTYTTLWYIRNAKTLSADGDTCDIPEFADYVVEYAKGQCMAKENGGVVPKAQQDRIDRKEASVIDTLESRIPDANTEIDQDLDIYYEHS